MTVIADYGEKFEGEDERFLFAGIFVVGAFHVSLFYLSNDESNIWRGVYTVVVPWRTRCRKISSMSKTSFIVK